MSSAPSHNPLRGILLAVLAVVVFASIDTAGKYLMTKYNVPLVAAIRYGINVVILLALVAPFQGTPLWTANRPSLMAVRGLALAFATLFMGLALQRMPLGETVALIYLQGFGVMIAARYVLGEKVSAVGWLCTAIGFAGVVLIARPGGALDAWGVVFALICAAVSVVYILLSRSLASTESTLAMLFFVAVVGTIFFVALVPFHAQAIDLSGLDPLWLTVLGAGSLAGHFLLTSAYRFAPASMLAPFSYFHIAFAVLLGWLVYNHVPDLLTLIGIAMIGGSGATIALHAHFSVRSTT